MRMSRKAIADCPIVHVTFLDHVEADGEAEIAKCELVGRLYNEDAQAYYLATWICDSLLDDNSKTYVILKHPGIKIRRLK